MKFHEKLRVQMTLAKMSNVKLSELTGFHVVSISRWRNGHSTPTISDAERLASALGCEKSALWPDDDEKEEAA